MNQTLWGDLFKSGIVINFAHTTFVWKNEARDNAAVFCVIVGFSRVERKKKQLFLNDFGGDVIKVETVELINGYLIDCKNIIVKSESKELSAPTPMVFGNKPSGKAFIISDQELNSQEFMESGLSLYVRPYYGAEDIIHNTPRLCIWLAWEDPEKLANVPGVDILSQKIFNERIDIKTGELKKQHKGYPCHLFRQVTQPRDGKCLVIPCTSTGRRKYIPMAFAPERAIISNSCQLVTNAGVYEFGILESLMHMVWMSTVCGRLKSDYRYSRDLCYNTFPWPEVKETQGSSSKPPSLSDGGSSFV